MSSRVWTAAFAVLTVAWAHPGLAATAAVGLPGAWAVKLLPAQNTPVDTAAHLVNLNLGGVGLPAVAQDATSLRSGSVNLQPGLQLDIARLRNWDTYGNLFPAASTLNPTYLSGTNAYAGMRFSLADNISAGVGYSMLNLGALSDSQPSAFSRELAERLGARGMNIGTAAAKLDLTLNDWAGLAVTASHTTGNASMLGAISGPLGTSTAESSALGISARVGFGEGWVTTLSYSEGLTQLDLSRDRIGTTNADPLRSQAYGIAIAKQGLFGADALGIALSQPLQAYAAGNNFGGLNSNFALTNQQQARESDVELGYVTTFLDGTIALQANAAYQMNAAGTKGQNAVAGVARAKLNF